MVKIFIEGGGNGRRLKFECRQAFATFFEKAGFTGNMPKLKACGSRNDAYDDFCTAVKNGEIAFLLVDSEDPISSQHQKGETKTWKPWGHLKNRDNWTKPHQAQDNHCHLMVQCMEHWFLADRQVLKEFFKQGYNETKLPAIRTPIEEISKKDIEKALKLATKGSQTKGEYHKGNHSFKILQELDTGKIRNQSPWANRLIEELESILK